MVETSSILLIGCGNPSRSDDGLGHHVIDALEWALRPCPKVKLLKTLQLDVTLAEQLARQDLVVFVDAATTCPHPQPHSPSPLPFSPGGRGVGGRGGETRGEGGISVVTLSPETPPGLNLTSHLLTPTALVSLAHWLYGRSPKAVLVAIPAHDFSFGNELSVRAAASVPHAVQTILEFLAAFDPALVT